MLRKNDKYHIKENYDAIFTIQLVIHANMGTHFSLQGV